MGPSTANLVSADFSGNGLTSLQPSIVAATGSTSTANVSMNIVEGSVTYDEEVSENEKVQGFASC